MDKQKLGDWQRTVDEAGFTPMVAPEVEGDLGDTWAEEGTGRIWQRLLIKYGTGQWVYWVNREQWVGCADTIFNGDAPHFVGYLPRAHPGTTSVPCWVMIEPKFRPRIPRPPNIEDIERGEGRYERNDVDRVGPGGVKRPTSQEDR